MPISDNRRIAKNSVYLYLRMMFIMLVTLYTSRVVLQVLGVSDYGIYFVAGGVVGVLSFLINALSAGASRFLAFELGAGDFEKLKVTFGTTFIIHLVIALLIVFVAETAGLWFVYNKLNIAPDRMNAAVFVYHISVLTSFITITQIPYKASLIAHERMDVYAYVSIVEVVLSLLVVYLLKLGNIDKLKLYAVLILVVNILIALITRFYCTYRFKETRSIFSFSKDIFKSIAAFSGWGLISGLALSLNTQGATIITNIFFGPAIVASQALSLQVLRATSQFVQSFRVAVNPQIVKRYAVNDFKGSKELLLESTKYSYYLIFLIGFPLVLLIDPIMRIWLVEVPEYGVVFVRLIIIQAIISVFDASFYTAFYATGRLKENALISPLVLFLQFPIVYLLFKLGYSPITLSYAGIVSYSILSFIVKPILVCKVADYRFSDIMSVFISCIKVTIVAIPIPLFCSYIIESNEIFGFLSLAFITLLCTSIAIYFFGLELSVRTKIKRIAFEKIQKLSGR